MARFVRKRHTTGRLWIRVAFAAVLILVFVLGIQLISTGDADRQERNLQQAIERDISSCYAIEGRYPDSLEYLKDNYGLLYNEKLFYVDYQVTGTNIRPVVTVIRREDGDSDEALQGK
ncbi:MAG: hypothetical protein ACI4ET_13510 [Bilifractor sp.]